MPSNDSGSQGTFHALFLDSRAQLEKALAVERRKARAGHWSYDLNRHLGLLERLRALDEADRCIEANGT